MSIGAWQKQQTAKTQKALVKQVLMQAAQSPVRSILKFSPNRVSPKKLSVFNIITDTMIANIGRKVTTLHISRSSTDSVVYERIRDNVAEYMLRICDIMVRYLMATKMRTIDLDTVRYAIETLHHIEKTPITKHTMKRCSPTKNLKDATCFSIPKVVFARVLKYLLDQFKNEKSENFVVRLAAADWFHKVVEERIMSLFELSGRFIRLCGRRKTIFGYDVAEASRVLRDSDARVLNIRSPVSPAKVGAHVAELKRQKQRDQRKKAAAKKVKKSPSKSPAKKSKKASARK
jgi:hypothetical protein